MVEIEKSVIRPTLEEWKTIFDSGNGKKVSIVYIGQGESSSTSVSSDRWSEVYAALIRKVEGTDVDETLREILGKKGPGLVFLFEKLGFNSNKEARWVIEAIKQPEIHELTLFVDGNIEIHKIDFTVRKTLSNEVEHPVIYDEKSGISFTSRREYQINNSKDLIVEDLESEYINIFDFDNTERAKVSLISPSAYSINPSTMETSKTKTNFLPIKKVITTSTPYFPFENNAVYIIKPKALNRLVSGKKIRPKIIDSFDEIDRDAVVALNNGPLHLVNKPLESIPNYFKEDIHQDKLNEVLTPNSVKKITSRLQYEVRLQGRQTREGRGEGKYTGNKTVDLNKPELGFMLYHFKNHKIYFPKMKEDIPLYIVVFYRKTYSYGDVQWEPADRHMLFYSDSEVNRYLSERMVSNKDWIKISKNIIRDTVNGVVSYLESLKVSYRVKGKLDLSKFSSGILDKINNNIKDIVENSMFGYLSQTARRGRRMQVKKNLLKSASDMKNTGNTIMRNEFGPLKEFKDLNIDEINTFVNVFKDDTHGKEYNFENTQYNLKYKFEPIDFSSISGNLKLSTNAEKQQVRDKLSNLDGDVHQYFSINSELSFGEEQGMGGLAFCYFFKDGKLDKIEGVVASINRYKSTPVISVAKKEISIEYPFDDMGVFMYEIITGTKYGLSFRMEGKSHEFVNSPVRRAQGLLQTVLQNEINRGGILHSNVKFNELRNEIIGYIVGRNQHNSMYYYLYPDSDYWGGTEAGQVCLGKIDLTYMNSATGNLKNFSQQADLVRYPTLQSFKDNFDVGVSATTTGTCVHGKRLPKGDTLTAFVNLFLGGTNVDYDTESSYRNIKDNTQLRGLMEGVANDIIAAKDTGVGGIDTERESSRLNTHLTLVRFYGQQFLDWTDSLVKKVLESGEVKIGGRALTAGRGTSKYKVFNPTQSHSGYAHKGKIRETSVDINEIAERIPEASRIFFARYGRNPTVQDSDVLQGIQEQINNGEYDEDDP